MPVRKPAYLFGARLDLDPADVVDVLPATIHRLHTFYVRQLDPSVMLPIHMIYTNRKGKQNTRGKETHTTHQAMALVRPSRKKKKTYCLRLIAKVVVGALLFFN